MTNIMAKVRNEVPRMDPQMLLFNDLYYPKTFGLAVADSLGSGNGEVTRGNQKLFQHGNNFVMGTGAQDLIMGAVESITGKAYETPEEIARGILHFTENDVVFQPGEMLTFIIAGYNGNELETYVVSPNRIKQPEKSPNGFAASGSGATFVNKARERDYQRGLIVSGSEANTIADLAISFADLGMAATKSQGVDSLLQFGFLVDGKAVALMNPNVMIYHVPDSYKGENGGLDRQKLEENSRAYARFGDMINDTWNLQTTFNQISSAIREGIATSKQEALNELGRLESEIAPRRNYLDKMIRQFCQARGKAHFNYF